MNARGHAWLTHSMAPDGIVLAVDPLRGSTSASLFAVEAMAHGRTHRAVLRVFTDREWLRAEPDLASHEAAVLHALGVVKFPAPRLIAWTPVDEPFGAPAVLMSRLEGDVVLDAADRRAWVAALAHTLVSLHRQEPPRLPWRFRSWTDPAALCVPTWAESVTIWRRAIDRWRRGPSVSRPVFLHRDFHPTNVLWREGRVCGVVDWVNGCVGPAGVDVAHCALNLALMFAPEVAAVFADEYVRAAGRPDDLDYWQIDAILGALPEPVYYEPWTHFGLGRIDTGDLRRRLEGHLDRILAGP